MKIVYVGAVLGSYRKLKHVLEAEGNVVAIITLDKSKSGTHSDYYDLGPIANENNIDLIRIEKTNAPEVVNLIKSYQPDYLFVWGWSQLIGKRVLSIPKKGTIGFHPTLLPMNRGRHPIIWTLVKGEKKTGATFFFMDEGADSGDILDQREIIVDSHYDAAVLMEKINQVSREMILDFLPKLNTGNFRRIHQDHTKATYWRKRTEKDGLIDFSSDTVVTYNLIRALAKPYVGAHTFYNEKLIKVYRSRVGEKEFINKSDGEVISIKNLELTVKTFNGSLVLLDILMEGNNIETICREELIKVGDKLG